MVWEEISYPKYYILYIEMEENENGFGKIEVEIEIEIRREEAS